MPSGMPWRKAMKTADFFVGICLIAVLMFSTANPAAAEIRIGILAKRGAAKTMQKWSATAEYLTGMLEEKVVIIPLRFTAIEPMVNAGHLDFLLANSAFFVEMKKKYQVRAVATLINSHGKVPLDGFAGVLLVAKESPIQTIGDIKGKKLMLVKFSSFGGGIMAWRLLLENGIDPERDTSAFLEGKEHDNVVMAVKNGMVDIGSVRSDTLERMQDEGKIRMSDFRIIHEKKDDAFPFVHSTRLYPEWPMAVLAATPVALSDRLAAALKKISPDSEAAREARIYGWENAADYSEVRKCLQEVEKQRQGNSNSDL